MKLGNGVSVETPVGIDEARPHGLDICKSRSLYLMSAAPGILDWFDWAAHIHQHPPSKLFKGVWCFAEIHWYIELTHIDQCRQAS